MADQRQVLYLIGQFPAINHSYLLAEVRHLRSLGLDVSVASVSPPDRPLEKLSPELCAQIGRRARARVIRDYDMARNTERFASVLVEKLGSAS